MSLTTEQLEQRLDYITGSDASVICGVNPWSNIIDLWRYKTRQAVPPDISDSPYIKAGNYLEPAVAQWFSDETGKQVEIDERMLIHPNIPYMAGNIDRRIVGESAILECKTTSNPASWGEQGEFLIPDYYLCQVAHYVAVCDVERAYIAVLMRGTDFRWYTYERNAKLESLIIQKEREFWDCVQTETPPSPRSAEEVISLYGVFSEEDSVIGTWEIQERIDELKDLRQKIADYQDQQKKIENIIKVYMGTKDTLFSPQGKPIATWKASKPTRRFETERFRKEHKDLYEKYSKACAGTRRFILK